MQVTNMILHTEDLLQRLLFPGPFIPLATAPLLLDSKNKFIYITKCPSYHPTGS